MSVCNLWDCGRDKQALSVCLSSALFSFFLGEFLSFFLFFQLFPKTLCAL